MKIKICHQSEIQDNQSIKFNVPGKKFDREAFLIKINDQLLAYYNECPHIGLALDWEDNDFFSQDLSRLVCKNHGAEFKPDDGECTMGPCVGTSLKNIEVEIADNEIFAVIT